MESTIEQQDETKVTLHVEIPADVVDRKLDEVYRNIVKDVEIPGFRKGHVPRSFLEMRFGEDFLHDDAKSELVEEYLPQALQEHDLEPIGQPKPLEMELEAGSPFRFSVEVEVFPEVELPDYEGLEVEAPRRREVTEEEVEQALEDLRVEHATLVPREEEDAVAQAEDVVVVRRDTGETHELQARSEGRTSPLIGHRSGDRVELRPAQVDDTTGDGETLTVTIDGIKRVELPQIKELAVTLGHADVEELGEEVRNELEERAEREHEQALRTAALDAVVARSQVGVPSGFAEDVLQQEEKRLEESGQRLSDERRAELREEIESRLKRDRVVQAMKEREGISLSDEEFETFLEEEAQRREMNPVKFRALLDREGQLERVRRERENRRALDLLVEQVSFVESGDESGHENESEQDEKEG